MEAKHSEDVKAGREYAGSIAIIYLQALPHGCMFSENATVTPHRNLI